MTMPARLRTIVALATLLALAAFASACSSDTGVTTGSAASTTSSAGGGGGGSTSTTDGSTTTTGGSDQPTDLPADQVVWQVWSSGGFVPYASTLVDLPQVTIYGDGRIFVSQPSSDGSESGARYDRAHPLATDQLSPTELADFLAAATASELIAEDVDYGEPGITDVDTTTVRLHTTGKEQTASVYALSIDADLGLTSAQANRRKDLSALIERSEGLADEATTKPWTADRVRVVALPEVAGAPDAEATPWPADPLEDLFAASAGTTTTDGSGQPTRCAIVSGADAAKVLAADGDAPSSVWTDDGRTWALAIRPLLPGEQGCPVTR